VVDVFLQKDWAEAAANAHILSLRRLADADAYLGIFGYRYGWVPEGQQRSVTELECEEAFRLWGKQTVPPIFLFMPEAGSEAASLLDKAASEILEEEYPSDEEKRTRSREMQQEFHRRLRTSGRFINPFATLQALRERAIASVSNWNVEIVRAAAAGPRAVVRDIPPSELGAIDREAQREGLEAVVLAVEESSAPGLCVAIHGAEDAGQFAFMAFLEQWNPWNISGKPHVITPSLDKFDWSSLISAALADIAPIQTPAMATVDALAAAIVDRSVSEPVVMFFPHLPRLAGGLELRELHWASAPGGALSDAFVNDVVSAVREFRRSAEQARDVRADPWPSDAPTSRAGSPRTSGSTTDHAIVIGVPSYPGLTIELPTPRRDGEAVYECLTGTFGVHPERVVVMTGEPRGPRATYEAVRNAFERTLSEGMQAADEDRPSGRRLYMYFSGLVAVPGEGEPLILTADATRTQTRSIAVREWVNWLRGAGSFDEFVIWIDGRVVSLPSFLREGVPFAEHRVQPAPRPRVLRHGDTAPGRKGRGGVHVNALEGTTGRRDRLQNRSPHLVVIERFPPQGIEWSGSAQGPHSI